MDSLTAERLGPLAPREALELPVNRWGDTASQIKARQQALDRHWKDPR